MTYDLSPSTLPVATIASVAVLTIAMLPAVYFDVRERRIPNRIIYTALPIQLLLAVPFGAAAFTNSVLGFASCFVLMLFAYCFFGMGAGDVKLAGLIGCCLGPRAGFDVICWAHLLAGSVAVAAIVVCIGPQWCRSIILTSSGHVVQQTSPVKHQSLLQYPIPMAVFFCLGTFCTLMGWSLI